MYIYCMYNIISYSGFSYIIHTVLEGYDSFVFSVNFISADAIKLNNIWASVDVTVIQFIHQIS